MGNQFDPSVAFLVATNFSLYFVCRVQNAFSGTLRRNFLQQRAASLSAMIVYYPTETRRDYHGSLKGNTAL